MNPKILQRGRAELSFISTMGMARSQLRKAVYDEVCAMLPNENSIPEDLDARAKTIEQLLKSSNTYANYLAVHRWHLDSTTRAAFEAFEANRTELVKELESGPSGRTRLKINPDLKQPDYWHYPFHATTGGYDGHEYMGFIHGELIHKWIVDAAYGGAMFAQRKRAASEAPRTHYSRILDMGCGTGFWTLALSRTFPDAEIWGSDCSRRMLEYAQRLGNSEGLEWNLNHVLNEDTKFASNYFDLVGSYILLHELPLSAMQEIFSEAYRILKPGGDLLMCDVTRYSVMHPIAVWQQDADSVREIEPFWRESASLDLGEVAKVAGFINVESYGMGDGNYPWIVRGRKPE